MIVIKLCERSAFSSNSGIGRANTNRPDCFVVPAFRTVLITFMRPCTATQNFAKEREPTKKISSLALPHRYRIQVIITGAVAALIL